MLLKNNSHFTASDFVSKTRSNEVQMAS